MTENREARSAAAAPALRQRVGRTLLGVVLFGLVTLLVLKPYLPSALYHNFAKIDDYKFFAHRVVKAGAKGLPWQVSPQQNAGPPQATQELLGKLKTTALLMIENNQIVYEKYYLTGGENEISGSFSAAKTIVGLLTGFALQENHIKSLDEPIATYVPEWADAPMG